MIGKKERNMIRVGICDDDINDMKKIEELCRLYFTQSVASISSFTDPNLFLSYNVPFDIILLDIMMGDASGIDVAIEYRKKRDDAAIIFLTNSPDYAVDAFSLGAVHYIIKPIEKDAMFNALDRALKTLKSNRGEPVVLHLAGGFVESISKDDIIYIESVGHKRIVHTKSATYEETQTTLQNFMSVLDSDRFIMPYRGYIINIEYVKRIQAGKITLSNGDCVLIKRGDFRRIRDIVFDYHFKGDGR